MASGIKIYSQLLISIIPASLSTAHQIWTYKVIITHTKSRISSSVCCACWDWQSSGSQSELAIFYWQNAIL